jgi:hypothetical protein
MRPFVPDFEIDFRPLISVLIYCVSCYWNPSNNRMKYARQIARSLRNENMKKRQKFILDRHVPTTVERLSKVDLSVAR